MKKLLALAVALALLPVGAQAQTIDFEGVAVTGCSTLAPNGYAGFNWSNFGVANWANCDPAGYGGYTNGTVSGDQVGFTAWENEAILLEGSSPFSLTSAWLTAAWNDGLTARIQGFFNGTMIYEMMVAVSYYSPTLVAFNWTGLDEVRFLGVGGTDAVADDLGYGTHLVIDDLVVNMPEPGVLLLLLSGGLGLAVVGIRRRSGEFA